MKQPLTTDPTVIQEWDGAIATLEDRFGTTADLLIGLKALAAVGAPETQDISEAGDILAATWDPSYKRALVAGLLRLIAKRPDLFEPKPVRIPAFRLVASELPDGVFRAAKVQAADQTYLIEEGLRKAVSQTLANIGNTMAAPVTADLLRNRRTSVMKCLRAPLASSLVEPFIPLAKQCSAGPASHVSYGGLQ